MAKTVAFFIAPKRKFTRTIRSAIPFEGLILARKSLDEVAFQMRLIFGCTEYLVFKAGTFNLVYVGDVLEHLKHQVPTLKGYNRVLGDNDVPLVATPKRLSITLEPCVLIWAVGYILSKWMSK